MFQKFTITTSTFALIVLASISINRAFAQSSITYQPPSNSINALSWLSGKIMLAPFEAYRSKFDECDKHNTFGGKKIKGFGCFVDANKNGVWDKHKVNGKLVLETHDHNNAKFLLKFPKGPQAILFQSKAAVDLDGSYIACRKLGATDQCPTSFRYFNKTAATGYYNDYEKKYGECRKLPNKNARKACITKLKPDQLKANTKYAKKLFVDSDSVAYTVLPGGNSGGFSTTTNAETLDVGIVIYNNHVVPVVVADRGPTHKLGEASIRLLEKIDASRCKRWKTTKKKICTKHKGYSVGGGITTIIFPGSKFERKELTPNNINKKVSERALKLFDELKTAMK